MMADPNLILLPIHHHQQYMKETCHLINREWQKSYTARYLNLSLSSDRFPTSFVLVYQPTNRVVGHAKVSALETVPSSAYIETVVIDQTHRGKGWGLELMKQLHTYLIIKHNTHTAYLSTKGQEKFYMKLGYETCEPIPLYGGFPLPANQLDMTSKKISSSPPKGPVPPPLPPPIAVLNSIRFNTKTFMMKVLQRKRT